MLICSQSLAISQTVKVLLLSLSLSLCCHFTHLHLHPLTSGHRQSTPSDKQSFLMRSSNLSPCLLLQLLILKTASLSDLHPAKVLGAKFYFSIYNKFNLLQILSFSFRLVSISRLKFNYHLFFILLDLSIPTMHDNKEIITEFPLFLFAIMVQH